MACAGSTAYAEELTVDDARLMLIDALLGGRRRWMTGDGARTAGDGSTGVWNIASVLACDLGGRSGDLTGEGGMEEGGRGQGPAIMELGLRRRVFSC